MGCPQVSLTLTLRRLTGVPNSFLHADKFNKDMKLRCNCYESRV